MQGPFCLHGDLFIYGWSSGWSRHRIVSKDWDCCVWCDSLDSDSKAKRSTGSHICLHCDLFLMDGAGMEETLELILRAWIGVRV